MLQMNIYSWLIEKSFSSEIKSMLHVIEQSGSISSVWQLVSLKIGSFKSCSAVNLLLGFSYRQPSSNYVILGSGSLSKAERGLGSSLLACFMTFEKYCCCKSALSSEHSSLL